jgi:hypothetical protein
MTMDAETIKSIAGLLSGGGSAAVIFLLWIAYNTLQRMRGAADDLKAIREALTSPEFKQAIKDLRDAAADMESVDTRLATLPLQVVAALSKSHQSGVPSL